MMHNQTVCETSLKHCLLYSTQEFAETNCSLDTGRNLNVHNAFRKRLGCLVDVLCLFALRSASRG